MQQKIIFILGLALAASVGARTEQDRAVIVAYPAGESGASHSLLGRGASRDAVVGRLGPASRVVSPDVWLYSHFRTNHPHSNAEGYDTLVVTFTSDRVTDLRVISRESARELVRRLRLAREQVALGGRRRS